MKHLCVSPSEQISPVFVYSSKAIRLWNNQYWCNGRTSKSGDNVAYYYPNYYPDL